MTTGNRHGLVTHIAALMLTLILGWAPLGQAQTTHTWTKDNPSNDALTVVSWTDSANWLGGSPYVSGSTNTLKFYDNTTTRLTRGSLIIQDVPTTLSLKDLTLNGQGPNSTVSLAVLVGDNTSTWTIGDGTSGTITQNANRGGGGDRYVNYTIGPNLILNQGTTTFTGNGGGIQGVNFTGSISGAAAANGITKSGNHLLVLSGANIYTGPTIVSGGTLRLNNANALPGGTNATGGTSALMLSGGVVELAVGDFRRDLGTGSDQFQITGGNSGFSAREGARTITVNNDATQDLVWGSSSFNPSQFVLNGPGANNDVMLRNGIDLNGSTRTIRVDAQSAIVSGDIGGAGGLSKQGGGTLILAGANTYTGNTTISGGTLSGGPTNSLGAPSSDVVFNGGTLRINGTSLTSLTGLGHSVTINNQSFGLDIADPANTFTADMPLTMGNRRSVTKAGAGTLILNQATAYTGNADFSGGTVVLDYSVDDNTKLSPGVPHPNGGITGDTGNLYLSNTELVLRGGTFSDSPARTNVQAGHAGISRDGGSATINLNSLSVSEGRSLSISADGIATTDKTNNSNGILGGWATVGSNWAKNSTNGADGPIVALGPGDYSVLPTSGGSINSNYQLAGSATLTGNVSANTLRLVNSANDDVLDLDTRQLSISPPNGFGGLLYAGGFNDQYTITGTTGNLRPPNGNQELNVNVYTGTLTMDVPILQGAGNAALIKYGEGTLVLNMDSNYNGLTHLNQGTIRLGAAAATGNTTNGIIAQSGAALELSNSINVGAETLSIAGSGVANGGALRNVSGANSYGGEITIGSGGARINSDVASADALTLTGGLVTAAGQDVTFGGVGNTTVDASPISGAGDVIKDGSGTLKFTGANSYTGHTTIADGILSVAPGGSLNASIGVVVNNGAELNYNASAPLTSPLTLNNGIVSGIGTIGVDAAFDSLDDVASPGNSPGIQPYGTSQSWSSLTYQWETNDFTGLVAGTDFDQIAIDGSLTLDAAFGVYELELISLDALDLAGDAPNFAEVDRSWEILTTTTGITNFDPSLWSINPSGFSPAFAGTWALTEAAGNLVLSYSTGTAPIPEPSTILLASLAMLAGLGLRRRRSNRRR